MPDLKIREDKIKEKRTKTTWKQFVEEIISWRSLVFYKNNGMVSRFPDSGRLSKIVANSKFAEIQDGNVDYGFDYDFDKNLFDNMQGLFNTVPLPATILFTSAENSDFADQISHTENVYLTSVGAIIKNVVYSFSVFNNCENVLNSIMVSDNSENIYNCTGVQKSYNIYYSKYIKNSANIWFSNNLIGCSECIRCNGLENQSFCIDNKHYEKEEYNKLKVENLKEKGRFMDWYIQNNVQGTNYNSDNVTGNYVIESNNVINGQYVSRLNNARNVMFIQSADVGQNVFDVFAAGGADNDDCYGAMGAGGAKNFYIGCNCPYSSNLYYCYFCESSSFCLGCVGLKNKEFCILNKQYTKEERYELANKIFEQMDQQGLLGAFFPGYLNPFYYNDTVAYLLDDSVSKDDITHKGYLRRDDEVKVDIPRGSEIISAVEGVAYMLPVTGTIADYQGFDENGNWIINPEIMKKVILDKDGNYYRIVKMEYDFLMKHGLPIPEIHWLDRIKLGFKFN